MTDSEKASTWPKIGAGIVAPISRINLAFPFSKITTQEPSKEFVELSTIVTELLTVLETGEPGEAVTALRQRAQVLAARCS